MPMTPREQVLCALYYNKPDQVPIQDPLRKSTVERWQREGLPTDTSPTDYFGYSFRAYDFHISFQLPEVVLEETDDCVIVRYSLGTGVKSGKHATPTSSYLDFAVEDRVAWEEHKPILRGNHRRLDWDRMLLRFEADKQGDGLATLLATMGDDCSQGFLGSECLLMAMLDDSEWPHDIFTTGPQLLVDAAGEMINRGFDVGGALLYDHMGYARVPCYLSSYIESCSSLATSALSTFSMAED